MLRRVVLLLLGAGALLVVPAGAAVAVDSGYAPTSCNFSVSRGDPAPGETITVSGKWPSGGLDVAISIDPPGSIIGRAITAADGTFTTRITIPSAQPLGSARLTARDANNLCDPTAVLAISKAPSGALAFTGSSDSTGMIVAVAAAAVALGSVLVVTARRRNRAHSRLGS